MEEAAPVEAARIAFLVERDGQAAAAAWIRRTVHIYRLAVLDRAHFASSREYRRGFIESYLSFKRWLSWQERSVGAARGGKGKDA